MGGGGEDLPLHCDSEGETRRQAPRRRETAEQRDGVVPLAETKSVLFAAHCVTLRFTTAQLEVVVKVIL